MSIIFFIICIKWIERIEKELTETKMELKLLKMKLMNDERFKG